MTPDSYGHIEPEVAVRPPTRSRPTPDELDELFDRACAGITPAVWGALVSISLILWAVIVGLWVWLT